MHFTISDLASAYVSAACAKQGGNTALGSSPETVEELRSRLFEVEEENASFKRAAEMELPREVDSLKHQVRVKRVPFRTLPKV